jgi:hypothetical protein
VSKKADLVRPGIVPGELLTVKDFCFRANLQRYAWSSLLRVATLAGYQIALKQGKSVFVDTGVWHQFLKETQQRGSTRRTRAISKEGRTKQVDTKVRTTDGVESGNRLGAEDVSLEGT